MKATLASLAALVLTGAAASLVHADPSPYYLPSYPSPGPTMSGPACFGGNYGGQVYGPYYSINPPWAPWNGFRPCLNDQGQGQSGNGVAGFNMHPFAHSPRDYFMED